MDKKSLAGVGAMMAAGIGSLCCVGPAVLAGLGFGAGTLSLVREMGVLHLPMMLLAGLLLALAFFFFIREKRTSPGKEECCDASPGRKTANQAVLWVTVLFTVFLFLYPYLE